MMLEINDDSLRMEYATETVEVEEICDEQNPAKKFKKVVKNYDQKYVTDWKNDPNYKNWVEKTKKDDEPSYQYEVSEPTECIEIDTDAQKQQAIEMKNVRKPGTSSAVGVKNNRSVKRQIKVMDPNLPAFVCTEHNENISLDCRYCRIASGFKKKNTQKHVQNDEISSSGKVTVAIPKPNPTLLQQKNMNDGLFIENNADSVNGNAASDPSTFLQKNPTQGKYVQKFRSEWLTLPEFKDWLIEAKMSEDSDISCAKCKYCGTLLVNNSNNLVRHAISKKHMKNMESETTEQMQYQGHAVPSKGTNKSDEKDCKEDIFGRYIASELKRIKSKKTYEEVKWKILQALQAAAEKETDDTEPSLP